MLARYSPRMSQAAAVLRSLEALQEAEPEVVEGFLLAALYLRAMRTGESPRSIADSLFKALPNNAAWPPLREGLLAALDDDGA